MKPLRILSILDNFTFNNLQLEDNVELNDEERAKALFEQLQFGYTAEQKDMIQYAHVHVHQDYTAKIWLKQILKTCNIDHPYLYN